MSSAYRFDFDTRNQEVEAFATLYATGVGVGLMSNLLDEHISPACRAQMLRRAEIYQQSELVVWVIGDPGAPPRGTPDSDILLWCRSQGFALVTNNRRSMPVHLAEHLAAGRHITSIFIIHPDIGIGQMADALNLIAYASFEGGFADRITFPPL